MYSVEEIDKESFYIEASAINTYLYCPRRCYYEYVQNEFESNVYTILGDQVHENVDKFGEEQRRGKIIYKNVKLSSDYYGVILKVDTVEQDGDEVYPVEYKRGKKGLWKNDKYQMTVQAMLLEEKLGRSINKGYIYYVGSKERIEIKITDKLKQEIIQAINCIRNLYDSMIIPDGVDDNRCKYCSIKNICLPMERRILKKKSK
ncbi:CRISPR-associated protein Cas4 [Clostridium botulinum C]|uniref:CRISPR-associated protein Cas4 n=1 Tax=Clostridium botulinum TaxID=1491 RepID=UPI001E556ACC|nr:CRISPR-associated protein Cas4 [Clostridium botulinum]MCD3245459.1 CRISPR-associated protein Cas4 [Clostridium botulinum C]MCD3261838.1 CRISPR-associated protein Cas4 [Clostridium botulinum C]